MSTSKVALGLSLLSIAGTGFLWAQRHDDTHPIAAVEEYVPPVADLTVQREHPERKYRGTEPRHLEPSPLEPAFPVMPGSPGYIKPERKFPKRLKTARIGDEVIEYKLDTESPPGPTPQEEIEAGKEYSANKQCIERNLHKQSDESMRSSERVFREEMAKRGNRGPGGDLYDNEKIEKIVEYGWQHYEECKGTTQERLDAAITQLSHATSYNGRRKYADVIRDANPEAARAIYEQLWKEQGRTSLLGSLGHYSLPHEIAYYAVEISMNSTPTRDGKPSQFLEHNLTKLAELENRVSPSEFREASQQAAQILRSPSCCTYP